MEKLTACKGVPTLRDIQLCELDILERFAIVCEKYNLKYYLVGGTLLGAVRHKGFIPWDDDVDVAMPRKDYDKFAELCKIENVLGNGYFYQDPTTDNGYYLPYAKIRKIDTYAEEPRFSGSKMEQQGIFIDVFPFDECSEKNSRLKFSFNFLAVMNSRCRVLTGAKKPRKKNLFWHIMYIFFCFVPKKKMFSFRNRILRKVAKRSDGGHYAAFSGAYRYPKEIFDKSIYGEGKYLPFEGKEFLVPEKYDGYLDQIFGKDYNKCVEVEESRHLDISKCILIKND